QQPTRGFSIQIGLRRLKAGAFRMNRNTTERAGPALPSYLALHHAGFSVPRFSPNERGALSPPFHPYLRNQLRSGLQVSLLDATVLDSTGGLFSVALSVSRSFRCNSPDVIRRVAPRFRPCDRKSRCPDFPPACPEAAPSGSEGSLRPTQLTA